MGTLIVLLSIVFGCLIAEYGHQKRWGFFKALVVCVSLYVTIFLVAIGISAFADEDTALANLKETSVHIAIGSGSIVEGHHGRKYLLTNWHVCQAGEWLGFMRANYEGGYLIEGKITKMNPLFDLCAVLLDPSLKGLKIAKTLKRKEQIYSRGYPYGVLSIGTGQFTGTTEWDYDCPARDMPVCVRGSHPLYDNVRRLVACRITYRCNLTNIYSRPGSSGSPVVNLDGEMVGVISSWVKDVDLGGMVPLDQIQEFFSDL